MSSSELDIKNTSFYHSNVEGYWSQPIVPVITITYDPSTYELIYTNQDGLSFEIMKVYNVSQVYTKTESETLFQSNESFVNLLETCFTEINIEED